MVLQQSSQRSAERIRTVKIVENKDARLVVKYKTIEEVINRKPAALDIPAIALVIGGQQGTGKTCLLNMFLSYLQYMEQEEQVY